MKKWFVAAAIAAVVAVPFVLAYRVHVAEEAWARTFGPIDSTPEQFRPASSNGKAADLALWQKRVTPQELRVRNVVSDYLTQETASPANRATANAFVLHFQPEEIDAFAKSVADDPPVFARVVRGPGEAVPNLFPVMQLQKTMLAGAMARAASNDHAGAERLLDASWALNQALRRGPTMIEQLVAIAVFRYELGVLRKTDVGATKWVPRIHSVDSFASIATVARMEAWYKDRAVRENLYASDKYLREMRSMHASLADNVAVNSRFMQLLRTPIRWFDLPSALEGDRAMIAAAATVRRSEHVDRDLHDAWTRGASGWAYASDPDIDRVNWTTAFRRAVRADAERELTEKVLLARSGKFEGSSAIDNAQWIYDGHTIRLSRPIDFGNLFGAAFPMRYDLN